MDIKGLKLLILLVCIHSAIGSKYNFKKKPDTPIINYRCLSVEAKCINSQSFLLDAITGYNLALLSKYEVNQACNDLRRGEICIHDTGCRKVLDGKIKLMKWICKNKKGLFYGKRCWKSGEFKKNAPVCDSKIQKSCHYHKLVGTCLKTVIGKNKKCRSKQMHFYGGLLEVIDQLKNPNGRCRKGSQSFKFKYVG